MRLPWLVFFLALALRFGHIWEIRDSVLFQSPLVDAYVYDRSAREIAERGPGALEVPYYQPPMYPMLLGGIYALGGGSPLAPRVIQAIAGAATVALVFLLAARVGGPRAGVFAALLLGCYGPVLFFEGELLPPSFVLCLTTGALYLLITADRQPHAGLKPMTAGLLLGLSTAIRPTALLFAAGALIWWVIGHRGTARAKGRRRSSAVAMIGAFLAAVLPFTAANTFLGGEPLLLSYNGGINLYLGNGANADSLTAIQPGHAWDRLQVEPKRAGVDSRREEQDYWIRRALAEALEDPAAWGKSLGRKVVRLLDARETPRNLDMAVWSRDSRLLSLPLAGFALVAPLAVLGVGFPLFDRRVRALLMIALGAVCVQNLLFFVAGRYRVEAAPVLCMLAGLGLERLWPRRPFPWPRGALAAAVVAAFVHFDFLGERAIDEPRAAMNRGLAVRRLGYHESARGYFQEALRLAPADPDAHRLLGELLLAEHDYRGAVDHFDDALAGAPDYLIALLGKAQALEGLSESAGAESTYRRALQADPWSTDARLNYGVFLAKAGRTDEARRLFEEGLQLNPNDTRFQRNLANLDQLERGS